MITAEAETGGLRGLKYGCCCNETPDSKTFPSNMLVGQQRCHIDKI